MVSHLRLQAKKGDENKIVSKSLRKGGKYMFGIGTTELVIILMIILIIFGVGKLPGIGTGLGQAIRNFKKSSSENAIDVIAQKEKLEPASLESKGS